MAMSMTPNDWLQERVRVYHEVNSGQLQNRYCSEASA